MDQGQVTQELVATIATLGTPGAAIIACIYLARELRGMTAEMVKTMRETIDRNTAALSRVETVVNNCPQNHPHHDA